MNCPFSDIRNTTLEPDKSGNDNRATHYAEYRDELNHYLENEIYEITQIAALKFLKRYRDDKKIEPFNLWAEVISEELVNLYLGDTNKVNLKGVSPQLVVQDWIEILQPIEFKDDILNYINLFFKQLMTNTNLMGISIPLRIVLREGGIVNQQASRVRLNLEGKEFEKLPSIEEINSKIADTYKKSFSNFREVEIKGKEVKAHISCIASQLMVRTTQSIIINCALIHLLPQAQFKPIYFLDINEDNTFRLKSLREMHSEAEAILSLK